MNYDRTPELRASEQDDGDFSDEQDNGTAGSNDEAANQDDTNDDAANDQADDLQADDADDADADDSAGDADADVNAGAQRRGIQQRARETRNEPIDHVRLASETAAATARTIAQETASAAQRAEEARQEREALAGMNDDQRATYLVAKETQTLRNANMQTQTLLRSNSDQIAFGRVLARKPQFAKYENEVEQRHAQILGRGGFATRQMILEQLIGEKALKAENVKNQKQEATRRIQAQRGGTNNGRAVRGDAGGAVKSGKNSSVVNRAERENWTI